MWHVARSKWITRSKCVKILCQRTKNYIPFLDNVFILNHCYNLLHQLPGDINTSLLQLRSTLATRRNFGALYQLINVASLYIHCTTKGWLGASTDGRVQDLTCPKPNGALEGKCPYGKHNRTPEEACSDTEFFCELVNSEVHLKRDHCYYHQVQLQLYVGTDTCMYDWFASILANEYL